jgi:hypothetical protein
MNAAERDGPLASSVCRIIVLAFGRAANRSAQPGATVMNFHHPANLHLSAGSHTDPRQGMCPMEAAIFAAGFPYRAVKSYKDFPPCFSSPIAHYAIALNDAMPDNLRDELLLPFVPRLAGTADLADVERRRNEYILLENVRRINAYICRKTAMCEKFAMCCEAVRSLDEIRQVMIRAAHATALGSVSKLAAQAILLALPSGNYTTLTAIKPFTNSTPDPTQHRIVFTMATEILDGAIRIGSYQEPECREFPHRHTITEAIAA